LQVSAHSVRAACLRAFQGTISCQGHSSLRETKTQEEIMNWDRIEGNWKQVKGKVKEKWGNISDSDLDKINGRRDQLEGILQERYGIAKDAAQKDVDDWLKTQH
jgi:uncharacterized protein YjbJ (UPF0337 family)